MRGLLPLTDVEYNAIVKAFTGRHGLRDRALFIFGCHTGFRINEILALKTRDVIAGDHPRCVVEVKRAAMKGKRESRRVPVPIAAQQALMFWWQKLRTINPDPNATFWPAQGNKRAVTHLTFRAKLREAALAAGITKRVSTHSMRKTFAARMYDALGRDLRKTQIALGHLSVSSTVMYLMGFEDEVQAAIQELTIGGLNSAKENQLELEFQNVVRFSDTSRTGRALALQRGQD